MMRGHCSPLHTWETSITYPASPVTETDRVWRVNYKNIFCLPLNIFSVPAPDRDPWTVLGSRAGGHFIHAAAHDSAVSAPPRTSQPPHNRGRAGHSNKFIFSTAAAVIISACNSPPSIIRYLMVTSRGDVGYNCNGYQSSLLIFTHVNLLLCFIGACADL